MMRPLTVASDLVGVGLGVYGTVYLTAVARKLFWKAMARRWQRRSQPTSSYNTAAAVGEQRARRAEVRQRALRIMHVYDTIVSSVPEGQRNDLLVIDVAEATGEALGFVFAVLDAHHLHPAPED